MHKVIAFILSFFSITIVSSQEVLNNNTSYTILDTLRGSITEERAWWDLQQYELSISINAENQTIKGTNIIRYKVISNSKAMQIDLQAPLQIDRITQGGKSLDFECKGPAHFVKLKSEQTIGELKEIIVEFSGKPHVAEHPPWDGGFSWTKDENGNHFIATTCQGIGASIWWPCKDHMYDEPDNGIIIHANVPRELVAVANGRLLKVSNEKNRTKTFTWKVVNPINNYGVNVNVGDYVNFSEKYPGEKGLLDMDYWVLSYNLEKAKKHFSEATRTMEAFEYWFGPYPFYEDSYKLVEAPYLGMEHQSSVTYGNGYQNGFNGQDLEHAGWAGKFDYIIIHETGHEWFANSISYKDIADMWIHEGFTCYSEALFLEYFYGKHAAEDYIKSGRLRIRNREPMISDYHVNASPRGDIYNKGSNMLHTLRQLVNNDTIWRATLRGLNEEFYHQTVSTHEIESYISKSTEIKLDKFFDQYLRDPRVPVFEYSIENGNLLSYRWTNCIRGFNMPLKLKINGNDIWLRFNSIRARNMFRVEEKINTLSVDPNFYIYHTNITGG
jgi:aminopeptidase N